MCGSDAEGTTIYTYSSDADTYDAQLPTLIARLKNDGITTEVSIPSGATLGCTECDKQQWSPEHVMAGGAGTDADIVGRLDASSQRGNRFGIGFYPKARPLDRHEHMLVARSEAPGYTPPYITEATYDGLQLLAKMIQLAGPKLTPLTLEQGAHTSVQLGGYENPKPWPGWKCCDPEVRKFFLGGADNYSAVWDAREIYWDDTAISDDDGKPGAWKCAQQCKRFEVGTWTTGEPKQ
jgi:hypothetical protein